jgi:hypothetical protein
VQANTLYKPVLASFSGIIGENQCPAIMYSMPSLPLYIVVQQLNILHKVRYSQRAYESPPRGAGTKDAGTVGQEFLVTTGLTKWVGVPNWSAEVGNRGWDLPAWVRSRLGRGAVSGSLNPGPALDFTSVLDER